MSTRIIRWPPNPEARRPLVSKQLFDKLSPEQKVKYRAPGPQHAIAQYGTQALCGAPDWDSLGGPEESNCLACLAANAKLNAAAEKRYKDERFQRQLSMWANFGEGEWGALDWMGLAAMTVGLGVIPVLVAKPFLKGLYHFLYRNKKDKP